MHEHERSLKGVVGVLEIQVSNTAPAYLSPHTLQVVVPQLVTATSISGIVSSSGADQIEEVNIAAIRLQNNCLMNKDGQIT